MRSGALGGERRQQRIMLGGPLSVRGRQVLEEIRELYPANAETLFRTNQFQPRLATKRHDQRHGKPTSNIAAGTLMDLSQ